METRKGAYLTLADGRPLKFDEMTANQVLGPGMGGILTVETDESATGIATSFKVDALGNMGTGRAVVELGSYGVPKKLAVSESILSSVDALPTVEAVRAITGEQLFVGSTSVTLTNPNGNPYRATWLGQTSVGSALARATRPCLKVFLTSFSAMAGGPATTLYLGEFLNEVEKTVSFNYWDTNYNAGFLASLRFKMSTSAGDANSQMTILYLTYVSVGRINGTVITPGSCYIGVKAIA